MNKTQSRINKPQSHINKLKGRIYKPGSNINKVKSNFNKPESSFNKIQRVCCYRLSGRIYAGKETWGHCAFFVAMSPHGFACRPVRCGCRKYG